MQGGRLRLNFRANTCMRRGVKVGQVGRLVWNESLCAACVYSSLSSRYLLRSRPHEHRSGVCTAWIHINVFRGHLCGRFIHKSTLPWLHPALRTPHSRRRRNGNLTGTAFRGRTPGIAYIWTTAMSLSPRVPRRWVPPRRTLSISISFDGPLYRAHALPTPNAPQSCAKARRRPSPA